MKCWEEYIYIGVFCTYSLGPLTLFQFWLTYPLISGMLKSPTLNVRIQVWINLWLFFFYKHAYPWDHGIGVENLNVILLDFFPLISMNYPSQSLLIKFNLKSILFDIKIILLLRTICFGYLFIIFDVKITSIFDVELCFLYAAEKSIMFSHSFCLSFIEEWFHWY